MPYDHRHTVDNGGVAGLNRPGLTVHRVLCSMNRLERGRSRNRHALPSLPRPEFPDERRGSANVIRVAMRERNRSKAAYARRTQDRGDDAIADVEGAASREPAGVDEQRRASWKSNEYRITLSDIDERDVEAAITARAQRSPRFSHNPERRGRGEARHTAAKPGNSNGFGAAGDPHAATPQAPGGNNTQVIQCADRQCRRRDTPGEHWHVSDQIGGSDEAFRAHVSEPAGARGETPGYGKEREDDHAGELGDRHQRNREEIQRQTRKRDARKNRRSHRQ